MPQWKPPWHDLLKAAASDQAVIGFALRSVGAVRLWPRFQPALHMCNCLVFDEIARRRCHPELEHNDLLDLLMRANGEPLSDNELRDQVFTIIGAGPRRRWRTERSNDWSILPTRSPRRPRRRAAAASRFPFWTWSCRKSCACARRSC